jgi:hypothetical protein
MERLAWYARARGADWQQGSGWIQDLVEGLVTTLGKVGKMNLDLMDLRTVVEHRGEATLIVGSGTVVDPSGVVDVARRSPLTEVDVSGAKGCMIQVEGGPDMTLAHLNLLSESLVSSLHQILYPSRALLPICTSGSGIPCQSLHAYAYAYMGLFFDSGKSRACNCASHWLFGERQSGDTQNQAVSRSSKTCQLIRRSRPSTSTESRHDEDQFCLFEEWVEGTESLG